MRVQIWTSAEENDEKEVPAKRVWVGEMDQIPRMGEHVILPGPDDIPPSPVLQVSWSCGRDWYVSIFIEADLKDDFEEV